MCSSDLGTDALDGGHDLFHGFRILREFKRLLRHRPILEHEEVAVMGQRLPDLLGDKGHEGMQHFQDVGQDVAQHLLRLFLGRLILTGQAGLGQLDIPIAIGVPDEVVQLLCSHAQLVVFHVGGHFADDVVQLVQSEETQRQPMQQVSRYAKSNGQHLLFPVFLQQSQVWL